MQNTEEPFVVDDRRGTLFDRRFAGLAFRHGSQWCYFRAFVGITFVDPFTTDLPYEVVDPEAGHPIGTLHDNLFTGISATEFRVFLLRRLER